MGIEEVDTGKLFNFTMTITVGDTMKWPLLRVTRRTTLDNQIEIPQ